jgi:hypothetical protein
MNNKTIKKSKKKRKKRPVTRWADQGVPPICCFKIAGYGEKGKTRRKER